MTENEKIEFIQLLNNRMALDFDQKNWKRLDKLLKIAASQNKAFRDNLVDEVSDVVNDFIETKLLMTDMLFSHIGAFHIIFFNFWNDKYCRPLNAIKRGKNKIDSLDSKMESDTDSIEAVFDYAQNELEKLEVINKPLDPSNIIFSGEDIKTSESAKNWLETMEREKGIWITAYLGIHICPSDRSIALNTLGKRMHLESYNYKAQRLGIKKGFWKDYKKTFIGQWMLQLDIPIGEEPITEETENIMLHCLKILCQVALLRVTDPIYQNLMSRT